MEPIRRVLVAVDLTPRSELVIHAARRVVPDRGAEFVLMHVVSDLESLLGVYVAGGDVGSLQSDIRERAQSQLERLRAEHFRDGVDCRVELRQGPIWSEIVAAAIAHRSDLAFVGAHFTDLPKHKTTGDIVAKVTKIAPCPVVVVPSDAMD